jgi:hypothetical protein
MLDLSGGSASVQKFDVGETDSLDNWAQRRGQYVAVANVSAAKYARDNALGVGSNSWMLNPYFGVYTYLPYDGRAWSPYGYYFWSPVIVNRVYYQPAPNVPGLASSGGGLSRPSSQTSGMTAGGFPAELGAPRMHSGPSAGGSMAAPSSGGSSGMPASSGGMSGGSGARSGSGGMGRSR